MNFHRPYQAWSDAELQSVLDAEVVDAIDPDDTAYEMEAPCPCCFESSGYMARSVPDTWSEPGWAEPDPTRPCEHCSGTGSVAAQPIDMHDLAIMCGDAP